MTYSFFGFLLLFVQNLEAQDTLADVPRPRIGLGTGVMSYYGEVQNYQQGFSPTVNRYGGSAYVNAPITRFLNLEFVATYAKIAANERTLTRNFNFESRIRMGSVIAYYNFYPFFQPNRSRFHPFIGTGFSSFEFLSKADLFNVQGQQYFYWSDGSIMSLAEDDPLASTDAVPVARDYIYETDLRELDADNLGKYREQSFAVPISIGAEWHMSPRWDFRISATYHFTFTDLIDNISEAGEGIREGDANNDRLLFSSVSLSYDLRLKKDKEGEFPGLEDEEGIELFADWDPNDFDQDGVIDAFDQCPFTPIASLVDENGCPLDSDSDGVPDFRDDEMDTKLDSYVDEFGVTLTEEDLAKHIRLFYDSTGYEHEFEEYRTEVFFNREGEKQYPKRPKKTQTGLKYVIVVGKERKDVTVNDLHKYLGYSDYSTVSKGDTIYYTLGEFDSIEDAVAASNNLKDLGVKVSDISRTNENSETLFSVDEKVIEKVERINLKDGKTSPDIGLTEQVYRIQLGAFKNKVDTDKIFPGVEDIVYGASQKDNINRYYSGSFKSFEEAEDYKKELAKKGIKSTFVVAYQQQKRVTLKEAGVEEENLPENYSEKEELTTFVEERDTTNSSGGSSVSENGVDESKIKYRIQLAYFKDEIPVETVDILYNIKQIKPIRGKDGSTTYYSRDFSSEAERDQAIKEYMSYGLEKMIPIIEYESEFYTKDEFEKKFTH